MLDVVLTLHFARAVTRELPNNFPFVVKKRFIGTVVEKWDSPAKTLFGVTKYELNKRIKEAIEDHFSQYTYGGLKQRVMCVCQCLCLTFLVDMLQKTYG
jgi:hypothetical protein